MHAGESRKYLAKSKIENRETEGEKEIKGIEKKSTNETKLFRIISRDNTNIWVAF